MQAWRKRIIWLVLLWLPVQGYAALSMPFACNGRGAEAVVEAHRGDHSVHHHDAQGHHHDEATVEEAASHGLTCDHCGLCELCCAPVLPCVPFASGTLLGNNVSAIPLARLVSFIPTLSPRPPSAHLV